MLLYVYVEITNDDVLVVPFLDKKKSEEHKKKQLSFGFIKTFEIDDKLVRAQLGDEPKTDFSSTFKSIFGSDLGLNGRKK